jgi:hypothetical protein
MQLTDRDVRILRLVADFRYMTREQVERLEFAPTTASYCKRRLSLLYHHAYLDRRFLPLRGAFGSARAYYTLDKRGASLLADVLKVERRDIDWRPRDGRREPLYMEHALRANDVRAVSMLAARQAGLQLNWLDERELRRRAKQHRVPDPLAAGEMITIIPDGHFMLGPDWSFALELDRGTVEETPFKRKIRGYGEWKTTGQYARDLGQRRLKVLFVITDAKRDPKRIARVKSWTEASGGGSLFWFAPLDGLTRYTFLYEPVWLVAGRTGKHSLIQR